MPRRLTDQERADREVRETPFMNWIISYARRHGWWVIHFHQSIVGQDSLGNPIWATAVSADARGAPDLILVKPARQPIWAEVKDELSKPTPRQWEWLDRLIAAGQFGVVWRPSMKKDIMAVLRG